MKNEFLPKGQPAICRAGRNCALLSQGIQRNNWNPPEREVTLHPCSRLPEQPVG